MNEDARFQFLLAKAVCAFFTALGAGVCGLHLVPLFLAVGVAAQGVCLFALLLWLGLGDIFLTFALEDERFYQIATETKALNVFEDTEFLAVSARKLMLCCNEKHEKDVADLTEATVALEKRPYQLLALQLSELIASLAADQ